MAKWYYSVGDRAQGPVDESVILETIQNGELTLVDLVYREGDQAWQTLAEVPEFKSAFSQNTPVAELEIEPVVAPFISSEPPEISSEGPFRFEAGIQLTWVLLQKVTGGPEGKPIDKYNQSGPFNAEELEAMLASKHAHFADYVWRPGYKRWTRLGNLPEFDRRRKNRDGDQTPELIPLPDVDMALSPSSRELLSSVVQAVPPSLSSLTVPQDLRPSDAVGMDLTEDTASQFDLRSVEKLLPPAIAPAKEVSKPEAPVVKSKNAAKNAAKFDPPPIVPDDVPKVPEGSITGVKVSDMSDLDSDATIVQSISKPSGRKKVVQQDVDDSNATIVHQADEDDGEEIEMMEMPARRWAKPAAIASGAVVFSAIGIVLLQKFVPDLPLPFLNDDASVTIKREEQANTPPPPRPLTREDIMSPSPPKANPIVVQPKPTAPTQPEQVNPATEVVAANPSQQPVQPEVKLPVKAVAAGAHATVAEVVPVRTDLVRPQFAINTDAPVGATVWLTISARTGEVLKYPSYYRSSSVIRGPGQVPSFDLTSWRLAAGQYRVEAIVGDVRTSKTVFIGKKDQQFGYEIEKHLKYLSYQQQEEKKSLFRSTRDLEKLAKNLGDNYFRMKGDARKWRAFYLDWQRQVKRSKQGIIERGIAGKRNELTYPDAIITVRTASDRLVEQARALNDSIMSNTPARDVASNSQLAIVKEFAKLRTMVAQLSSRK